MPRSQKNKSGRASTSEPYPKSKKPGPTSFKTSTSSTEKQDQRDFTTGVLKDKCSSCSSSVELAVRYAEVKVMAEADASNANKKNKMLKMKLKYLQGQVATKDRQLEFERVKVTNFWKTTIKGLMDEKKKLETSKKAYKYALKKRQRIMKARNTINRSLAHFGIRVKSEEESGDETIDTKILYGNKESEKKIDGSSQAASDSCQDANCICGIVDDVRGGQVKEVGNSSDKDEAEEDSESSDEERSAFVSRMVRGHILGRNSGVSQHL